MRILELARKLESLIPPEKIMWAASEAEISGATLLFFKLSAEETCPISQANLVIKYSPYRDEVLWGELEFIISPDIEAVRFMNEIYPKLISQGFKVVVDSDGVFISCKLGEDIGESRINNLYERVCRVLGSKCGALLFRGVVAIGER